MYTMELKNCFITIFVFALGTDNSLQDLRVYVAHFDHLVIAHSVCGQYVLF